MSIPRYIAICGNPKSGKSEVQKILNQDFGIVPVDDGFPLRNFCIEHLGMSYDDVNTHAGKSGTVKILGKEWERRKILGEYGRVLERMFGEDILSYIATRGLDPAKSYSFGSVRMNQGAFYKKEGGIVLGIRNPLAKPTGNTWDGFNEDLVDQWIENDGQSRRLPWAKSMADLRYKVHAAIAA